MLVNRISGYALGEEECLNYTVYPVQYDLTIVPYIISEGKFYYDCDLTISVIANVPGVRIIELDAKDLNVIRESVGVWDQNRDVIDEHRPIEHDQKAGKLYLYLKEELREYGIDKNQYEIKMKFQRYLNYEINGIFVVRYNDQGRNGYMLSTRISPNYAKTVFPCFDNPQFEAVFKFRFYLPPANVGLLNPSTSLVVAEEMRRLAVRDNFTVVEFMPSPQISTYQVGLHLSSFTSHAKSSYEHNDTIIIWTSSSANTHYAYMLNLGADVLNIIHSYAGIKRPITKDPISIVAIPSDINSYEKGSWNLLTNGDHKLSYQVQFTSAKQKEAMSIDLAQQLSRIWLGNPGEPERTRWKEEWFKEGMATYLAHYFLSRDRNLFWDMSTYGLKLRHKSMDLDWHPTVPALTSFNRTLAINIPSQYDDLVTLKTASLIWMVENWLGTDVFHRAVKDYITNRRGKIISIIDFSEYLQSASVYCEFFKGYTVADVLNSWVEQPGYPIVNVRVYRNPGNQDAVHLEQKHFVYNSATRKDYKYLIPISYNTQFTDDCYNCFQPKFTISGNEYTFKENLNNGWIILNRNSSGYYRVNYDIDTWKLIIKGLKGHQRVKIDPYSRAQIMNDAFALYMAGEIGLDLATDILDCLDHEHSYIVWDAAFSGFEQLKHDSPSVEMNKQLYNYWKKFMRQKLSIIYPKLANKFERDLKSRLFRSRVVTFACAIDHVVCLKNIENEMERVHYRQTYDPDLRELCYYKLLNHSQGWQSIKDKQILNGFEYEDASVAEELARREIRFTLNLPSSSKPMELRQTTVKPPKIITTTMEPLKVSVDKQTGAAGSFTIHLTLLLSTLALTIFSYV